MIIEQLDGIDWSAIIPFVQDAWETVIDTFSQLFQAFVDFMRQVVAFWNENGEAIENAIRNVKTFVRKIDEVLTRIYSIDSDRQVWVVEAPDAEAIDIEEVPERLRETLSADGRIGLVSAEDEERIRERFS